MFRDITIGQYYPGNSILHRLDPRVKLLGVIVYVAILFIINNIWTLIFPAAILIALIAVSKIPVSYILKGMRMLIFLMAAAVFFNVLFTEGEHMIWRWWILKVSYEGILRAVFFAVRLMFVVVGASMLTYTTTPTTLTNGLEKVFSPLKKIHFPAHELAMMMSIALRFIPILAEEMNKIIKAQLARGADFESGGLVRKARGMVPILIPLFISAFRRASDLATAMEARCYHGGDGRTRMHPLRYKTRDKASYVLILFALLLMIAMRILTDRFLTWGSV